MASEARFRLQGHTETCPACWRGLLVATVMLVTMMARHDAANAQVPINRSSQYAAAVPDATSESHSTIQNPHPELAEYPNSLISRPDHVRAYTATDVWEVWLCDVKNSNIDLTLDETMTMLDDEVVPYFKWMSDDKYSISFVPGGIFESKHDWNPDDDFSFQHPDCGGQSSAGQSFEARGGIPQIAKYDGVSSNGMIVVFNHSQFKSPGFGTLSVFDYDRCPVSSAVSACDTSFPHNARRVFVDGVSFSHQTIGPWLQVVGHDLGHALEWPHSYGSDHFNQYANFTDLMSGHGWPGATNALNRYAAGWISDNEVARHLSTSDPRTYRLHAPSYAGTQLLTIPGRDDEEYYVLGARTRQPFDALPEKGEGVEVYRIDQSFDRINVYRQCLASSECFGFDRRTEQVFRDGTSDSNYGHIFRPGDSKVLRELRFDVIDRRGDVFWVWVGDKDAPEAPNDTRAERDSAAQMTVRWSAPSSGTTPTGYEVQYRSGADAFAEPTTGTCANTLNATARSCNITGLTTGTDYEVRLRSSSSAGAGPWAPMGPTVERFEAWPADASLVLAWDPPASTGIANTPTSHAVQIRSSGGSFVGPTVGTCSESLTASTTTCTITGLTNDTSYEVRVAAVDRLGAGSWTDTATVTPKSSLPAAPGSLTVTAGDGTLTLSWPSTSPITEHGTADPSISLNTVTGHKVAHRTGDNAFATPQAGTCATTLVSASTTSCTITGLTNGDWHDIRLRATSSAGDGPWSNTVSARPVVRPPAPTGVAVAARNDALRVTWSAPSGRLRPPVKSVAVQYRRSDANLDAPYQTACPSETTLITSCLITGLTNGTAYTVRVRFEADKLSAWTSSTGTPAATAPAGMDPPTSSYSSDSQLGVEWTAPTSNGAAISGYTLEHRAYSTRDNATWTSHSDTSTSTSRVIDGLRPYTRYQLRVRAANAHGNGDWSAPSIAYVTPRTAPDVPSSLNATRRSDTLTTTWTAPATDRVLGYQMRLQRWNTATSAWSEQQFAGACEQISSLVNSCAVTAYADGTRFNGGSRHRVSLRSLNHVGNSSWTAWVDADSLPSFGASSVPAQRYVANTAIDALVLPEATGGDGALAYSLSPELPAGLAFSPVALTITGTPTQVTPGAVEHTLTATDEDGDTATLTFSVTVTARAAPAPGPVVVPEPVQRRDYFVDDDDSVHHDDINTVAAAGITLGCNAQRTHYCPDQPVTRAQMASFLTRALKLTTPTSPTAHDFEDVTGDNAHHNDITAIAKAGITLGCNTERTRYCPDQPVTRAQMASFLTRALKLTTPTNPTAHGFEDVTGDNAHHNDITAIAAAQITLGCNTQRTRYCPDQPVTRAQMASFLTRALKLTTNNPA